MATDEELAQQLQQGDRAALGELVERHYDPLLGYLYRLARGDRTLAQDLAQETFLRALRGIDGYDLSAPVQAVAVRDCDQPRPQSLHRR